MQLYSLLKSANIPIPSQMENRPVLSQSISRVTDKSFEIVPASLFIAIKGLKNDGHHYLAEAKTGVPAAIVERQVDVDLPGSL